MRRQSASVLANRRQRLAVFVYAPRPLSPACATDGHCRLDAGDVAKHSDIRGSEPPFANGAGCRRDSAPAAKKNGTRAIGKSRGGWNTKIYMVAADARRAVVAGRFRRHAGLSSAAGGSYLRRQRNAAIGAGGRL